MDWLNTNFYRDWGYNLCYPQLFPHLKRRSDEAQAATLEMGKDNAKRWLKLLDEHWIGPKNNYLCGDESRSPTISAPAWSRSAKSSASTSRPIRTSSAGSPR